jgi:transposase
MDKKFSIKQFNLRFPDNDACLEEIKQLRFGVSFDCPKCHKANKFYRVAGRSAYACAYCGHHIYPLKGSIFDHSSTELKSWFYAIYLMAQTRAGVSAKQLERELGVTYKTAWRMFHQIRSLMAGDSDLLIGQVEVDETYLQPRPYMKKKLNPTHRLGSNYADNSQIIFGMVERGGKAKVQHVISNGARVLQPAIEAGVEKGTTIYSDEWSSYNKLEKMGYPHFTSNHRRQEFVKGHIHTQNVENLWSNMKRGIKGVYRHVDAKYLQAYINEYAFRYSYRKSEPKYMFDLILSNIAQQR